MEKFEKRGKSLRTSAPCAFRKKGQRDAPLLGGGKKKRENESRQKKKEKAD